MFTKCNFCQVVYNNYKLIIGLSYIHKYSKINHIAARLNNKRLTLASRDAHGDCPTH